jgi:pimeloyl-ACP methyl ester carboxylesterase
MPFKLVGNLKVGYRKGNSPFRKEKPTLVMIHGSGGNRAIWSLQLESLDEEINIIALDLPGHGQSGKEHLESISGYSKWLYEVLKEWFQQPIYLMGHSMGGAIVQEIAINDNNHLLKGLILMGTGAMLKVAPQFLDGLLKDFENTVDKIVSYAYLKNTEKELIMEGARMMKGPGPIVVHSDFLACDLFDIRKKLKRLSVPCLIICGEDDKLTPPNLSRFLNEHIPVSTLKIIPNAGHMVMIERYKEVNTAILEFIHEIG